MEKDKIIAALNVIDPQIKVLSGIGLGKEDIAEMVDLLYDGEKDQVISNLDQL